MIHVCVPVLKRYDLLRKMLLSLRGSTVPIDSVVIIDNGLDAKRLSLAAASCPVPYYVHVPDAPMGVAESWNWFMQNVEEERIIANDDVIFAPQSVERLVTTEGDLLWAEACGFSCFVLRDSCIEKLGFFDESISPGYGYYEDEDYLQRLDGRGSRPPSAKALNVEAGVQHLRSQTLAVATPAEAQEHHRKFKIAQQNYARKWHLEAAFGLPVPKVEVGA